MRNRHFRQVATPVEGSPGPPGPRTVPVPGWVEGRDGAGNDDLLHLSRAAPQRHSRPERPCAAPLSPRGTARVAGLLRRAAAVVLVVLVGAGIGLASAPRLPATGVVVVVVPVMLLGTGGVVLRRRRRRTIGDGAAIELAASAPLLAHLAPPRDLTTLPALLPGTPGAEMFHHLRVVVDAEVVLNQGERVVVAGVTGGDANVWLGANLAISLAHVGRRVLLVDGRMGSRFGRPVEREPDTVGLYDVLTGTPITQAMSPGPAAGLTVLPSGSSDVEPPETLIASTFAPLMRAAQEQFDVIVVLAPPLDLCDDAQAMAADGGALLLVVPDSSVTSEELRAHTERVRSVGARLLGVVLLRPHSERAAA